MKLRNVSHKGLRRFIENGDASGLPPAAVEKIRNILTFLLDMGSIDELRSIPSWKAHQLSGNRKGVWALHVTRNWRMTFKIDEGSDEIVDLTYEDYH